MVLFEFDPKDPRKVSRSDHRPHMKDHRSRTDGFIDSLAKMSQLVLQVPRVVLCRPFCALPSSGRET
jgi:hypothetical protein